MSHDVVLAYRHMTVSDLRAPVLRNNNLTTAIRVARIPPMATEITPPGSFLEAPLTPPPTEEKTSSRSAQRALNCFKLHRAGYRPQYWWQHRLKLADYTETLRVLDSDKPLREYVGDKVR